MSTNLHFLNPNFDKNPKKSFVGTCWVKIGLRKTQRNGFNSKRDSGSSTGIIDHKTNDGVMKSELGARFRGSDAPSGHSVSQHGR